MLTGRIKFFNQSKGYGFTILDDGGPDIFFHVTTPAEGWSGYTEDQSTARLLQAAVYIDRLQFVGEPTYDTQKRAWPRRPLYEIGYSTVLRVLGKAIGRDEIPEAIKRAQCELALTIFDEDGNVAQPSSPVRSEILGKWSISYQQYIWPVLDCQPALDYLYPFLVESTRIERA